MSRTMLMSTRIPRSKPWSRTEPEAEPVIVDTTTPSVIVVELDDGDRLEFDAVELRAVIKPATVPA